MQKATPKAPFANGRRGPISPYTDKLLALKVGERFHAPTRHRAKISVLATRWGRRMKRQFKTRSIVHQRKSICLVCRVA